MYYINPKIKNLYRISYGETRKDYLKLDMNENPDGLPDKVIKDIFNSITIEDISMYPETNELVTKLADSLNYKKDNICLTNGSDDAIRIIMQAFGKDGSEFVSAAPTFEMYSVYSKMYGLNIKSANFNKDFTLDIEEILTLINENTSLILLLNPNSPVGEAWTKEDVDKVINKAKMNNAIVIIDEAYLYFHKNDLTDFIRKYNNVIFLRTFSKAYAIAGCRIGYALGDCYLIEVLKKCSSSYPVNILGIKSAQYLLDNPKVLENMIKEEQEGRKYLIEKLNENNYEYSYNGGNYLLIKSRINPEEIFYKLKEKRILVKKYSSGILKSYIRITTGSKKSMEKFWDEFKKVDL